MYLFVPVWQGRKRKAQQSKGRRQSGMSAGSALCKRDPEHLFCFALLRFPFSMKNTASRCSRITFPAQKIAEHDFVFRINFSGGVMCAEGIVCGATSQFSLCFFPQACDSSGLSGHGLNPHMTKLTMSTTRWNDAIHTL